MPRARRSTWWFVPPVAIALSAGCRGILGIHDLPGDEVDGTTDDASDDGEVREDGAVGDAMPDVVVDDGGGDAAAADGSTPFSCDGDASHVFCTDFDGADIEEGWSNDGKHPDPGISAGVIAADQTTWRSAPQSVVLKAEDLTNSAAWLGTYLPTLAGDTTVELAVRVDTETYASDTDRATFVDIEFDNGNLGSISLTRATDGTYLEVSRSENGAAANRTRLTQSLPYRDWCDVKIVIENVAAVGAGIDGGYGGAEGKVTVFVGGVKEAEAYLPATFRQAGQAAPWFTIGPLARFNRGLFRAEFDNVRVSIKAPN